MQKLMFHEYCIKSRACGSLKLWIFFGGAPPPKNITMSLRRNLVLKIMHVGYVTDNSQAVSIVKFLRTLELDNASTL